jgi:hypothetical protein
MRKILYRYSFCTMEGAHSTPEHIEPSRLNHGLVRCQYVLPSSIPKCVISFNIDRSHVSCVRSC